MKRTRQDIEAELRSLLPKSPSDRVLNGVSSQLTPTQRAAGWGNAWGAVAVAVAAGIAVAVLWWPQPEEIAGPSPSVPIVDRQPQRLPEVPPPTMLAYQHAWGLSPNDFDELLARHAEALLVAGQPSNDIGTLDRDLVTN